MHDVILLATADWDEPFWTNKQHMATLFAKHGYRVLYVDSTGLRRPTFRGKDLKRMLGRLLKALPIPRQVYPNIWRVSPLLLPFHGHPMVRTLNQFLLRIYLRWHMALLGLRQPMVWTYNPLMAELSKELAGHGLIYHCVDDLAAVPRVEAEVIRLGEQQLGKLADLCFVTSPLLREHLKDIFPKVIYDSNVCDPDFFETARLKLSEPIDLQNIPHPRLIFIGALSEYKVDFQLIESLAERKPDLHWLLIGEPRLKSSHIEQLKPYSNIHILGSKPYGSLPHYLAHADMAVIPEKINSYTSAMFPMKFFEFLAAGLPIVGTRLPALTEFENLYFPANSVEEFENNISQVLTGKRQNEHVIKEAYRFHSWEARFTRMELEWEALNQTQTTSA